MSGKIIEFDPRLAAWAPPDDSKAEAEEMTFLPPDMVEFVKEDPGGDRKPETGQDVSMKTHANRLGAEAGKGDESADNPCFIKVKDYKLPFKEITFDDTGEQPDLI